MNVFQKKSAAELVAKKAAIKANRSAKSKQMSPLNRAILDSFITLTADGEWFNVPVPANLKADPDKFAKRVSNFLTTQKRKNRSVNVDPDDSTQIIVERVALSQAA